jgi:hypothetical protein
MPKEFCCFNCKTIFLSNEDDPLLCHYCSKMLRGRGRNYVRTLVRIRDKFTCQDCGDTRTPNQSKKTHKKLFDVHHLNGLCGKRSRIYDRVKDMGGLITLCHKCHYNRPDHSRKSNPQVSS